MSPRIEVSGLTKRFGGARALENVSFAVAPGTVHAILGANGAGKSTLIKVISGFYRPDAGELRLDGTSLAISGPRDAIAAGIITIYQDTNLCPELSVTENLMLGHMGRGSSLVRREEMAATVRPALARVGLHLDPHVAVGSLSPSQRQLVEISRALLREARVMIFDEPTAALTQTESERLFGIISGLKDHGVTVLYISHRLPEVFAICDNVTVLRDGRHVMTRPIQGLTTGDLVQAMIGRAAGPGSPTRRREPGNVVLQAAALCGHGFRDVSLELRQGEVLGLFGLVGSGRTELALALYGAEPATAGAVTLAGAVAPNNPAEALAAGVALVPEDRKRNGRF